MRLREFINESNKNKDINIIVLTSRKDDKDGLFKTASQIKKICIQKKINCYIAFVENAYIDKDSTGDSYLKNLDDDKGIKIDSDNTVAIIRGSVASLRYSLNLLSQLEKNNIFCINSRETLEECSDKYRTVLLLSDASIICPKTSLVSEESMIENAFENIGGKFPVILKTITGSKGIGVFKADTWEGLKSTLQTVWKINPEIEILLQSYIQADYDIRTHVLNGEVIASMRRYKVDNDFRSNFSLGGKVKSVKLSKEQEDIAINAADVVGGIWCGVDMMIGKDGTVYVLEINSSPGTTGIEKATNIPVVKKVIDFIINKDNWIMSTKESGFIENVKIEQLGKNYIKAKMDTGNGSYSVIHADKWKINGKKVVWYHDGKKIISDLIDYKNIEMGGVKSRFEKRPVVMLDMVFNDKIFDNIKFTLSDRDLNTTMILLNRRFIRRAGLVINPGKKFILSEE